MNSTSQLKYNEQLIKFLKQDYNDLEKNLNDLKDFNDLIHKTTYEYGKKEFYTTIIAGATLYASIVMMFTHEPAEAIALNGALAAPIGGVFGAFGAMVLNQTNHCGPVDKTSEILFNINKKRLIKKTTKKANEIKVKLCEIDEQIETLQKENEIIKSKTTQKTTENSKKLER